MWKELKQIQVTILKIPFEHYIHIDLQKEISGLCDEQMKNKLLSIACQSVTTYLYHSTIDWNASIGRGNNWSLNYK